MSSGPSSRGQGLPRRTPSGIPLRRKGAGPRREGTREPEPDRARERRNLVIAAVVIVALATAAGIHLRNRRAPLSPPAEVDQIARALRATGHDVGRVARNANGGWSVLFDDGEVQWFRGGATRRDTELHPIRLLYKAKDDPNIAVVDLHATVFAIVMSGRRQGSTLELGTARTSAAEIATLVRTAVGHHRR